MIIFIMQRGGLMIEIIFISIVAILSVLGICEVIHAVRLLLLLPERRYYNYSLLYLKKGKAISQLKFAVEQRKWFGDTYAEFIIAVYDDLDSEELKTCSELVKKDDVVICPIQITEDIIRGISKNY